MGPTLQWCLLVRIRSRVEQIKAGGASNYLIMIFDYEVVTGFSSGPLAHLEPSTNSVLLSLC